MNDFPINLPDDIKKNITLHWEIKQNEAVFAQFPEEIPDEIKAVLASYGIQNLYQHQFESIKHTLDKKNVVISTGTASGKSLTYQIPIVTSIFHAPEASSLLLFPTKALAADQNKSMQNLLLSLQKRFPQFFGSACAGLYDGDTSQSERSSIRKAANIIISNPDMLHIGILPHHPSWEHFFSNLKYVVLDEIHIYRGVFGSHLTNVIRRLKRIAKFYNAYPQFILTSATIAQPKEFAEKLTEEKFEIINIDYSPKNKKTFAFYNPPVVEESLGLRRSMFLDASHIAEILLFERIQTIVFARTRKTVEKLNKKLNSVLGKRSFHIAPYRSGYLKSERCEIEAGIKSGNLDMVISTTALELGIDMGMVDAIVLLGYPGSISRFYQQAGRAGRKKSASICIMIASPAPIDQYIINHPDYLLGKSSEGVLIDPNNVYILFNHIKCAAFELPFKDNENYGSISWDDLLQYLQIYEKSGEVFSDRGKYYWRSTAYPANSISLRSILGNPLQLTIESNGKAGIIGEIDRQSAKKMTHNEAIYLHKGTIYYVQSMDLEKDLVHLKEINSPYYTEPLVKTNISVQETILTEGNSNYSIFFGDIKVIEQVSGYRKVSWETNFPLSKHEILIDPDNLFTKGFWIFFTPSVIDKLIRMNLWTNLKINYGNAWKTIREYVIIRDKATCQVCGINPRMDQLQIHHIKPFREFLNSDDANNPENLITLCPVCHKKAEKNVKMRSILAGFGYTLLNISPILLNCDVHDLGYTIYEKIIASANDQGIILFDQFPGGIGLAENLFTRHTELFSSALDLVTNCSCKQGCPSCVGPPGENGMGAKAGVIQLLLQIVGLA